MNPASAPSLACRYWFVFAAVFFLHFLLHFVAFYYAMSWSIMTPAWLPLPVRMAVADSVLFVLSFPLSLINLFAPFTSESFLVGWAVFALVSVAWAFAVSALWCALWRHSQREGSGAHAG